MKKPNRHSSRSKHSLPPSGEERRTLLDSLDETKRELDLAYLGFNQSTDPDLIEFYLFEIDALRARHTYLLRRIKALDPTKPAAGSSPAVNLPNLPLHPN